MKKISLFLVFIWCFLPFNIALAACSLTGGACAIDDIIADKKIEKPVSAPILKPTVKKEKNFNAKFKKKQIKINKLPKKKK